MKQNTLLNLRKWEKQNKELSKNVFLLKDMVDIIHTTEVDTYRVKEEAFKNLPINEIYNLKKLEKLYFRFNGLEKLSDDIKKLTKLKELRIEEASDLSIENELYSLSELENLSIVNFGISEISEDISKLKLKLDNALL